MSGFTSAVPQPVFGPTGFVAPDELAVLAGVQSDISAAFGGALNPGLYTPQGQLASTATAIIGDANAQFLYFCNQMDPAYNSGRMQDGIARIYFLTRNPAVPTAVQGLCSGLTGVVVPVGQLAQDLAHNIYAATASGTIGVGGSVTLPFACQTPGPIPCAAGSLSVYQALPGLDSISNPADGVLGNLAETRAAFEARRAASVSINSVGSLPAVLAAVLAVPGVLDAYATENTTGSAATVGGVSIAAHSLYVAVSGGASQAVAQAIWSKKMPGCGYTGSTTVTVTDSNSGYALPLPSYSVSFQIATPTPVYVRVSIANTTAVPSAALASIQAAVIAAFAGTDGGPRARIGGTLFASRFYAGIAALGPWAQIVSIQLSLTSTSASLVNSLTLQINQAPAISAANVALTLV